MRLTRCMRNCDSHYCAEACARHARASTPRAFLGVTLTCGQQQERTLSDTYAEGCTREILCTRIYAQRRLDQPIFSGIKFRESGLGFPQRFFLCQKLSVFLSQKRRPDGRRPLGHIWSAPTCRRPMTLNGNRMGRKRERERKRGRERERKREKETERDGETERGKERYGN